MEMNSAGGTNNNNNNSNQQVSNMFENTSLLNDMNLNSTQTQTTQSDNHLDNLSNLLINNKFENNNNTTSFHGEASTDESTAFLEQYEYDMDKILNEKILADKEQTNQRLFQSFQTSACAVAQMFKDKTSESQTQSSQSSLSVANQSWQSFQNSAGAITVLYKDSLEACKVHYELGVSVGQQRKLKELINWLKKKKRRSIRKDELISFLIGRQYPTQPTSIFTPLSQTTQTSVSALSSNQTTSLFNTSQTSQKQQFILRQPQLLQQNQQQIQQQQQQQQQSVQCNRTQTIAASANPTTVISENTCSDLATFREALIMHSKQILTHIFGLGLKF